MANSKALVLSMKYPLVEDWDLRILVARWTTEPENVDLQPSEA
jgi:hypothetical protein